MGYKIGFIICGLLIFFASGTFIYASAIHIISVEVGFLGVVSLPFGIFAFILAFGR